MFVMLKMGQQHVTSITHPTFTNGCVKSKLPMSTFQRNQNPCCQSSKICTDNELAFTVKHECVCLGPFVGAKEDENCLIKGKVEVWTEASGYVSKLAPHVPQSMFAGLQRHL